jgi:hypothetical protein
MLAALHAPCWVVSDCNCKAADSAHAGSAILQANLAQLDRSTTCQQLAIALARDAMLGWWTSCSAAARAWSERDHFA